MNNEIGWWGLAIVVICSVVLIRELTTEPSQYRDEEAASMRGLRIGSSTFGIFAGLFMLFLEMLR
jgi:hypothetical protein